MSKRSHRREVRAWQEQRRRHEQLTTPRHYLDGIALRGIGIVTLRIARLPSFALTELWEVRRDGMCNEAHLFVARSTEPGDTDVVGYASVDVDSTTLEDALRTMRLCAATAHPPEQVDYAVLDGVWLDVSFHSPIARTSFYWCETKAAPSWACLERSVREFLRLAQAATETPLKDAGP